MENITNSNAIDFKALYNTIKAVQNLESKRIKKLMFYNYINDSYETALYDCREYSTLSNKNSIIKLPEFPNLKASSRLILIINDKDDIKNSEHLEPVRKYIKSNELIHSIYHIYNADYNDALKNYPFIMGKNIIKLPLCAINNILYIGNFINSKNKQSLSLLKVKTIISLMKEPDKELAETFLDNYRNFKYEEINHDELEFQDIIDYITKQINDKQTPILLYDFAGKCAAPAVAAIYLMESKKWSLDLSMGYILKLSPNFDFPSWIYMQLQRFTEIKKHNELIKSKNNYKK